MRTCSCGTERCFIQSYADKKPKSIIGRIWRWHINWCPGWKKYYNSLSDQEKQKIKEKYGFPTTRE